MASYNRVVLMGNVTRDPDLKSTGGGTVVARTGLAVNRKFKDKEEVLFIDITAFGKTAEIMGEYVVKGNPLLVEGRLSMSSWEQDGVKRTKHEVIVDTIQMLGGKKDSYADSAVNQERQPSDPIDENDVPF